MVYTYEVVVTWDTSPNSTMLNSNTDRNLERGLTAFLISFQISNKKIYYKSVKVRHQLTKFGGHWWQWRYNGFSLSRDLAGPTT